MSVGERIQKDFTTITLALIPVALLVAAVALRERLTRRKVVIGLGRVDNHANHSIVAAK